VVSLVNFNQGEVVAAVNFAGFNQGKAVAARVLYGTLRLCRGFFKGLLLLPHFCSLQWGRREGVVITL
jgi:hypothetical protein